MTTVVINLVENISHSFAGSTTQVFMAYDIANLDYQALGYSQFFFQKGAVTDAPNSIYTFSDGRTAARAAAWIQILGDLNGNSSTNSGITFVQGALIPWSDANVAKLPEVQTVNTNSSGDAVFTFTKTYSTAPKVFYSTGILSTVDNAHSTAGTITVLSTTGVTIRAQKAVNTTVVLGGTVDPDSIVATGTSVSIVVYS